MKKVFLLIGILFIAGCVQTSGTKESAIELCKQTCNSYDATIDLSRGPCIADPIETMPDWVCDIVNDPREEVDDFDYNQCSSYIEGSATHFVELDENCELIRAV